MTGSSSATRMRFGKFCNTSFGSFQRLSSGRNFLLCGEQFRQRVSYIKKRVTACDGYSTNGVINLWRRSSCGVDHERFFQIYQLLELAQCPFFVTIHENKISPCRALIGVNFDVEAAASQNSRYQSAHAGV